LTGAATVVSAGSRKSLMLHLISIAIVDLALAEHVNSDFFIFRDLLRFFTEV
jgi:hypothetical protein